MKIKSFEELFETGLRYAYDCEQKLAEKGIPTMIENCSSPELRSALEQHLAETRNQIARLERVFSIIGADAKTHHRRNHHCSQAHDQCDGGRVSAA